MSLGVVFEIALYKRKDFDRQVRREDVLDGGNFRQQYASYWSILQLIGKPESRGYIRFQPASKE